MENVTLDELQFTLRRDQNGYRPVFSLGNALGMCPYNCKFCGVKSPTMVTFDEAIRCFNEQFYKYFDLIDGLYHPVIYNQGNVTNSREFPKQLLDHILDKFNSDNRVLYVSLNSREKDASSEVLNYIVQKKLSYPIHFIFGLETFSERMLSVLGKNTRGELERFIRKLAPYNNQREEISGKNSYTFGLDVNLVFLPELYLNEGEKREKNISRIGEGIKSDLARILKLMVPNVPVEINIHPYHHVDALPYRDADLDVLIRLLPELQELVEQHNELPSNYQTHLFLGVEGCGYISEYWKNQIEKWQEIIDEFNRTG